MALIRSSAVEKIGFLQSLTNLGYSEAGKLKRDVERLDKNGVLHLFLEDFTLNISSNNLVTPNQWNDYNTLEGNHNSLEIQDIKAAMRREKHKKNAIEKKSSYLTKQLEIAQTRKEKLERQLEFMEATLASTRECEEDLQTVAKLTHVRLKQAKSEDKEAQSKYSRFLSDLNNNSSLLCCDYENMSDTNKLLSHVDLDSFLLCEDDYTSHLTRYAKKQFMDASTLVDNLSEDNSELRNITDTVLLQDETHEIKSELLSDLRRATLGYASRKKRVIFSKAEMEKAIAVSNLLQNKLGTLKYGNLNQDHNSFQTLKSSCENIRRQVSHLSHKVLPDLIAQGIPLQRNHLLTGNFTKKLTKQRSIINKQKKLIGLLLQQCSRMSTLWMMLQLEKTQASILSKKMGRLGKVFKVDHDAVTLSTKNLTSVQHNDNSSKEPKAVIDKRDSVMLALHELLASETSNSMFQTFESVHQAATNLCSELPLPPFQNSNEGEDLSLQPLLDSLRLFYWDNSDANSCMEEILLTPTTISESLNDLLQEVSNAKISVPKVLSKVDKKRAFLEHNVQAEYSRNLWIDFILNPTV